METPRAGIEHTAPGRGHVVGDDESARDAWWSLVGTIVRRRRFIIAITLGAAVASVIVSLFLPKWYEAQARVMLTTASSGGGLTALLGNLDPSAASLLGVSQGDYIRYLAILNSGTLSDRVIEEFNLMDEYDTRDANYPRLQTRKMLASNVEFEIDREFEYLSVKVLDKSAERAARMANFFVDELNRMNIELTTESAGTYRKFVERRYEATVAALDSAMLELKRYQEESGVIELEQQSEAFLQLLAAYKAATFEAEVEYQGLLLDFGEDNPAVKSAFNRVKAARAKERDLLTGKDPLMPVAMTEIPQVGYGYTRALRDVLIYQKIVEFARPLLEQAIFEEQKEAPAVQVLDRALTPEKKAKPKRMLIVAASTLSIFILVVLYLASLDWLGRNKAYLSARLQAGLRRKE